MVTVGIDDDVKCAACGSIDLMGLEYEPGHPERYDGISEWVCCCGARTGRWTGKLLNPGEAEPRKGLTRT